jgi:hypothetical protein
MLNVFAAEPQKRCEALHYKSFWQNHPMPNGRNTLIAVFLELLVAILLTRRGRVFVSIASVCSNMLRCNMNASLSLQLGLDDLLADLQYARRHDELGRLALIAYCDVRSWARQAGEFGVADHSSAIFTDQPHACKEAFLEQVDRLIDELEQMRSRFFLPAPNMMALRANHVSGQRAQHH